MDEIEQLTLYRRIAISSSQSETNVSIPKSMLPDIFLLAFGDSFNEAWYLEQYPDVAQGIEGGYITSALDHWVHAGVFEGRLPWPVALDEDDYARRHKDVARAVRSGSATSLTDHFVRIGFLEGREYKLES